MLCLRFLHFVTMPNSRQSPNNEITYRITSKSTPPLKLTPLQWDNDAEQWQTMAKMLRYNGE